MAERTPGEATQAGQASAKARTWRWPDVASLLVLLVLAAGVRTWLFCHTEVAARDSISFIRMAWQLQHQSWRHVLNPQDRNTDLQHPGYPVLVMLAAKPVRYFLPGPEALVMQYSAQLTSVLAGTLLVVPMFYLGKELFNRTSGFWAAILFQFLPASSRVLSDGLSEATFLLFTATALYLAVRALRVRSPMLFGLCGLFGALAYLTRPEGALIVLVTGAVLLATQFVAAWRQSWLKFALCAASLVACATMAGSPIYLTTGKLTLKNTATHVINRAESLQSRQDAIQDDQEARAGEGHGQTLRAGAPLFASLLAVWVQDAQGRGPLRYGRVVWGLWALGFEINKGFHYAAWVSALLGLWWFRGRLRLVPGAWVLLLLCGVIAVLLWRVAALFGYLSDRHTLLLLLCGSYWAAAAVAALAAQVPALLRACVPALLERVGPAALGRFVLVVLLAALVGSALPKSLEPPHLARGGFRDAGLWLAEHAQPADPILDPYCWSTYYAGRLFHKEQPAPPGYRPTEYVVLDESGNAHPHLPEQEKARKKAEHGTEVYRAVNGRHINVAVYAVPRP
jgi:hypothetical protein